MRGLVVLILLGVAGYFAYRHFSDADAAAPDVIEHPVYADIRLDVKVAGRELQFALFGEMAGEEDCKLRSHRVWDKVIDGCKECVQQTSVCTAQLEPRYRRLFDNTAIHSAYMSFTRGSKYERDGRMVVFGLTADEGDVVCEHVRQQFQPKYSGIVECVKARRD